MNGEFGWVQRKEFRLSLGPTQYPPRIRILLPTRGTYLRYPRRLPTRGIHAACGVLARIDGIKSPHSSFSLSSPGSLGGSSGSLFALRTNCGSRASSESSLVRISPCSLCCVSLCLAWSVAQVCRTTGIMHGRPREARTKWFQAFKEFKDGWTYFSGRTAR